MNIKTALNWAANELNETHDSAKLDSEVLLSHTLTKDRSHLYTWPEKDLTSEQLNTFQEYITKRKSGIPIAYLLGHKEFWSLTFDVCTDTLIPRPETELLVEQALGIIPKNESWTIADMGTGSGAIAIAVAYERGLCQLTATDYSQNALDIAINNAFKNKIKNIRFVLSHWFDTFSDEKFNMIISNPPYVAERDPLLSQGDVRFEPSSALRSGIDGLNDIKLIINNARNYLYHQGWLLLEHGFEQHTQVQQFFRDYHYKNITTINDLSGHPRVSLAQY